MIWALAAGLGLLAAALLVWPLLARRTRDQVSRAEYERAVYTDQLRDFEREAEEGLVTGAEAEAAKLELERRLLRTRSRERSRHALSPRARAAVAGLMILVVPALSLLLYARLGHPDLEEPAADRPDAEAIARMSPDEQRAAIADMVAGLAARLEENPDDLEGWMRLAQAYRVLGQADDAVYALENAVRLAPDRPDLKAALAGAMIEASDPEEPLPERVFALYREVLAADPDNADALFFMGLARLREGDVPAAEVYWRKLLAQLEPGSPIYERLQRDLEQLERMKNADGAEGAPPPGEEN